MGLKTIASKPKTNTHGVRPFSISVATTATDSIVTNIRNKVQ